MKKLGRILLILLLTPLLLLFSQLRLDRATDPLESRYFLDQSKYQKVQDVLTHYTRQGKGEPLLLLHGTASSLHTWNGWSQQLSGKMEIIRLDLPGYGLTGPWSRPDYGVIAYTDFIAAFMDSLKIPQAYVAGNSLGGQIAWNLALRHPKKVKKLVLLNPAGIRPTEPPLVFRFAGHPLVGFLARYLTPQWLVAMSVRDVYGDPSKVTPELITRYHELILREGNRRAMVQRMQFLAGMPEEEGSEMLKNIKHPTLVMWGESDRWLPIDMAYTFEKEIPGALLKIYPGLGHVPMEESPELTANDAYQFLMGRL